jgi:shikimate kinase
LLLAKELAKNFIDTDILIQTREGKTLQDILHHHGYQKLRDIEEEILLGVSCSNHVIATGGSAVYSEPGMKYLNTFGPIVFLDASIETLQQRIHNYETRGIARRPGQSFAELFDERRRLYQRYANITIQCDNKNQDQIVQEIIYQEAEAFAEMDA